MNCPSNRHESVDPLSSPQAAICSKTRSLPHADPTPADRLDLNTVAGAVVGVPLAILTGKALSSALYGIKSGDPASFVFALAGIAIVALAASWIPARRAANVDPLTALRSE